MGWRKGIGYTFVCPAVVFWHSWKSIDISFTTPPHCAFINLFSVLMDGSFFFLVCYNQICSMWYPWNRAANYVNGALPTRGFTLICCVFSSVLLKWSEGNVNVRQGQAAKRQPETVRGQRGALVIKTHFITSIVRLRVLVSYCITMYARPWFYTLP